MVVQGDGPGPRYGHVMDLVSQRYLVTVTGNDGKNMSVLLFCFFFLKNRDILTKMCLSVYGTGKRALSDAWALDTAQKPYVWQRLNPDGDRPSARMLVIKLILMVTVERLFFN